MDIQEIIERLRKFTPQTVFQRDFSDLLDKLETELSQSEDTVDEKGLAESVSIQLETFSESKDTEALDCVIEFIQSGSGLLDSVAQDLNIDIDYECSQLFDMVKEKHINISFEEVVLSASKTIVKAISSFQPKQ
jgi:hypothetical protein